MSGDSIKESSVISAMPFSSGVPTQKSPAALAACTPKTSVSKATARKGLTPHHVQGEEMKLGLGLEFGHILETADVIEILRQVHPGQFLDDFTLF